MTDMVPAGKIRQHVPDIFIGMLVFCIALCAYNATLTPSLSFLSPDGNELATIPHILGLAHSTGYPLYTWLGKLFTFIPVDDIAHRMNLMSAIMGAGSVALLYGILLTTAGCMWSMVKAHTLWLRLVSACTALLFAFSITFWSQTTISEVYAPNAFMVGLQILLLLHWSRVELKTPTAKGQKPTGQSLGWFSAFCLTYALSSGTHSSSLGFGLGYAVFVLAVSWRFAFHPRALAVGIGSFVIGMMQHLWLPYKASTSTDVALLRNSPTTLQGFYDYTLGAFSGFRFAFPWSQIPDRVVIYLDLLRQQFGLSGIVFGIIGMWALLVRQPLHWWLFSLLYLVHLVFFIPYRVFDLDVFFIPSHYIFAVYIGLGLYSVLHAAARFLSSKETLPPLFRYGLAGIAVLALLAWPIQKVTANWEVSDRSKDVAINDFYNNVWEMLPANAALFGRSGVFGYDMFYWRLVYNIRPDVLIPYLPNTERSPGDLAGRPLFSTLRLAGISSQAAQNGSAYGNPNEWLVPVLFSTVWEAERLPNGFFPVDMVLYQVITNATPNLLAPRSSIAPEVMANANLGTLNLIGYTLDDEEIRPGGRMRIVLYWDIPQRQNVQISLQIGEFTTATHTIGFGNLSLGLDETNQLLRDSVIVEEFWVVIPSTAEPREMPLSIWVGGDCYDAGTVNVQE